MSRRRDSRSADPGREARWGREIGREDGTFFLSRRKFFQTPSDSARPAAWHVDCVSRFAMDGCDILRDELTLTLSGLWDDTPSRGWFDRWAGVLSGVLF